MNNLLHYDMGPGVVAFSTRRQGGVSRGSYASFNVNPYCGDDPADVAENLRLLADGLSVSPRDIVFPHQTHGTEVAIVDGPVTDSRLEGVDGVCTAVPGLCVAVSTADCIPILLYDPVCRAVAAIHAGWRGTVAGIAVRAVERMASGMSVSPGNLRAVIGPGIGLEAFEVGDEVYDAFSSAGFPMDCIARRMGKWHINLPEANAWLLRRCGVQDICMSGICTYSHHEEFFSARRLGVRSGRILSGIMLLNDNRK